MRFLELLKDPVRREKAAQEQEERREKNSHVTNRTPAQANFLFGMAIERQAQSQLDAYVSQGEPSGSQRFVDLRDRFAEAFALQAGFAMAAEVTGNEERRAEYLAKAEAIKRAGEKLCECPDITVRPSKVDAKGLREPTRHLLDEVYDGERVYSFFKCRGCGAINAELM